MGLFKFLANMFKGRDKLRTEETGESTQVQHATTPAHGEIPEKQAGHENKIEDSWTSRITLSSADLMHMAEKLKGKGEYYRAEQLLRDGVKDALNNQEFWALLLEVEEPLNRKGRAYYCIEHILQMDPENEIALKKYDELKLVVDGDLGYFIEYKLAPEFFKLQ